MSKSFWIHAGITVAVAALGVLTPAVKNFALHHSAWAGTILTVWSLLGAALNPKGGVTQ